MEETHLWRHSMAAICSTISVRGLEIFGAPRAMPCSVYAGRPSDSVYLEIFLLNRRRQRVNVKEKEENDGVSVLFT